MTVPNTTPPPSILPPLGLAGIIEEKFEKRELAIIVAAILLGSTEEIAINPEAVETVGRDFNLQIIQHDSSPGTFRLRAREKQRETGWYLVYDGNFLTDRALWWDDDTGQWRESPDATGPARLPTAVSNPRRIRQ